MAPPRGPRAILFPKGYRVTATGSVWAGPVGAVDACVHPHAQHQLRNGSPCSASRGSDGSPRLDRVEALGDPQFVEVLRIVESVEPTLMDLIDVRDEETLHGGTMRTPL